MIDTILVLGPAYRTASALGKSDADYKGAVIERPVDIGLGVFGPSLLESRSQSVLIRCLRLSRMQTSPITKVTAATITG